MIIKKIVQFSLPLLAGISCLCFASGALAWQQAYPTQANAMPEDAAAFHWEDDRPANYEDILRKGMYANANLEGRVNGKNIIWNDGINSKVTHLDIDWNFPLARGLTTGPTAALRWDSSDTLLPGGRRGAIGGNDPLWHASTTALGWQVSGQLGPVQPWARIGFYQQYGENLWKAQPGMSAANGAQQEGGWTEFRLGADMPVSEDVAAFAMFSQADGLSTGENLLYLMGVNARF
ncbi:hypothetical protein TUM12370_01960 [Salmonella enterica subsp. enterica serovar Choleraesuis]|nr:hypothetical protein TUM12370_01960 [Salmonella enterica subsp. enterica serovar Choleraesuis]